MATARPAAIALLIQVGAVLLVYTLALPLSAAMGYEAGGTATAWCIGVLALLATLVLGLPGWWRPIQLLFAPAAHGVQALGLPPGLFLAGFLLLLLVYGGVHRSRVPLYLSSRAAKVALVSLLPKDRTFDFLDIGAGTGTVLAELSDLAPHGRYNGVESAWLPWLVGCLRLAWSRSPARMKRGDFWDESLEGCDVVYAFLSPAPMEALWRKVRAQMRPGSIFISNSFSVPGVQPSQVIELGGLGNRCLYVYRLA